MIHRKPPAVDCPLNFTKLIVTMILRRSATLAVASSSDAHQETRSAMATDPLDSAAIDSAVAQAYSTHRHNSEGRNAKYIPVLADVDPGLFALCAMTPAGHICSLEKSNTSSRSSRFRRCSRWPWSSSSTATGRCAPSSALIRPEPRSIRCWHSNCITTSRPHLWSTRARSRRPASSTPMIRPTDGARSWMSRVRSPGARCPSARRSTLPSRPPTRTTRPSPG